MLSGYSFFYEFPYLNADCFQHFLELVSAELGDDIAVIQFDQGSFHQHNNLHVVFTEADVLKFAVTGLNTWFPRRMI